jgi:hypothetical protein
MPHNITNKYIKIFFAIVIIVAFFNVINRNNDPDFGWHLRVGHDISLTGNIPDQDEYSFSMPDHHWVDHEWIQEVIYYAFSNSNNLFYLKILLLILASTPFLYWIYQSKRYFDLFIITLSSILFASFIGLRSQVVSFFFLFLVTTILYSHFVKGKILLNTLSLLPPLFFFWANLHASFIIGLVFFALLLLVSSIKHKKFYLPEFIVFLASVSITFINVYGWRLYQEIFQVMTSLPTKLYIKEWLSPFINFRPLFSVPMVSFLLFIFFIFYILYIRHKKFPVYYIVITPFLGFALMQTKMIPMFIIIAIPFLLANTKYQKNKFPTGFAVCSFITIILFGVSTFQIKPTPMPNNGVIALNKLIIKDPSLKVLNNYGWGGYILALIPNYRVFIDGRMPHWVDSSNNSAMLDYIQFFNTKGRWYETIQKYGINTTFLETNNPINKFLLQNNWKPLYIDPQATILHCDINCYKELPNDQTTKTRS